VILTIAGKELKALFASPLAWVLLCFMQIIVAFVFLKQLDVFFQIQPQLANMPNAPGATDVIAAPMFGIAAALFLFAVPILGMRLIAEERRNQTMVLLMSAPVSMAEIVLGKFLGLTAFFVGIVALAALMPLSLAGATRLDYGLVASLVAGLVLLAAAFVAVSLYVSCLTVHPVAAAVGAFAVLMGMLLMGDTAGDGLRSRGWAVAAGLAQVLSPMKSFEAFRKGIIDSYAISCLVLLTALFLVLAIRHLDAQRLRG
jgi:ABC-2 type transport system permease protein